MPTRAANTYASLRTVLNYTDAAVIDAACLDHPVPRNLIDGDGVIRDAETLSAIARALVVLANSTSS